MTLDYPKKIAQIYDKMAFQYAKNINQRVPLELIKKFILLLNKKGVILDVGCAAGRDSRILKDYNLEVIGIDLSKKLLEIAKKNNPDIIFQYRDMRKTNFSNNFFDGIYANAVFHHLKKKDRLPTLKEFRRILKDKGILFLRTKMGKGKWRGNDSLSKEVREFTLITKEELEKMTKRMNFKTIELFVRKDKEREIFWLEGYFINNK